MTDERSRDLDWLGGTGPSAVADPDEPRADELPGGDSYAELWTEAERAGTKAWRNATDEERIRLVSLAAVARRHRREQIVTDPGAGGIDAADLLGLDLPALRWVVPDLLPEGTTVIAAAPKVGKSCLIYQVVVETALGGDLFGRRVTPGSALYLALEDGQRRGQDRLRGALAGRTMPRGRLEVRWAAPKIGAGLEESLNRWLDDHPDATVVALDTLGRVRARDNGKSNAYQVDVDDLGRLQGLFRDRAVALIIVHHAKKESADDFVAAVSGTYGVAGSADTIIAVKRPRAEAFGTVSVTGRDVPDLELPVRFVDGIWEQAPAAVSEGRFERIEVYEVVRKAGPLFPQAIARMLDKERTAVQHIVSAMVKDGALVRTSKGYVAPIRTDSSHSSPGFVGPSGPNVPPHSTHSSSEVSEGVDVLTRARAGARGTSVGDRMAEILADVDVELEDDEQLTVDEPAHLSTLFDVEGRA